MAWKIFADDTTRLLKKCLAWQSRRQEIIAGNIANLDTPGYRRQELNFQEILHRQLQGGPEVRLASSHPAHVRERPPGVSLTHRLDESREKADGWLVAERSDAPAHNNGSASHDTWGFTSFSHQPPGRRIAYGRKRASRAMPSTFRRVRTDVAGPTAGP